MQHIISFPYGNESSGINYCQHDHPFHCKAIWDPDHARLTDCFLPLIPALPAFLASCIILDHFIRLLFRSSPLRRPRWAQAFIKEPTDDNGDGVLAAGGCAGGFVSSLFLISMAGVIIHVVGVFYGRSRFEAVCEAASWTVACLIVGVTRPKTVPFSLLILYCGISISLFAGLVHPRTSFTNKDISSSIGLLTAVLAILTILCMPLRNPDLPQDHISPAFASPTSLYHSPEDNLTLWQFLTVSWMSPLMRLGRSRQLNDEDVWTLSYEFQHKVLHENFRALQGSVLRRLLVANGIDLVLISLLGLIELVADCSAPILLQQLLKSMENPKISRSTPVTYAVLSLVVRLVASQSAVLNIWFSRRSYERSRGELITMLSGKTMSRKMVHIEKPMGKDAQKLVNGTAEHKNKEDPEDATESASTGKVLNLIRFDAYEVAQRFWEFQDLITQPLSVVFSVVLIWEIIGWPCLLGVLTVFVAEAINAFIAKVLMKWERVRREATDNKLQKISQFVEAIRHLRWYGWQDVWLERILDARQRELALRVVTGLWGVLIRFTSVLTSGLFPVVAFYAYTALAGKPLRIDIAFPALQLFSMLENSIGSIPGLITVLLNASVALGRIQEFMNEPDKEDRTTDSLANEALTQEVKLELRHASFAWPGAARPVLHNLTLLFPAGLTLISGEVGAGKSCLLQALLGELDQRSGEFRRPSETVGYCAQSPWLQTMSIRENILFSAPYEEARYQKVLEACALTPDMASLKHGDLSNIGENGIGLSGGQRARVALARAVYSRARILLLDDPISALDQQTAETIVRNLFSGGSLLSGRTTILVTHRTDLCHGIAKQMIEISDGKASVVPPEAFFTAALSKTLSPEATHEATRRTNEGKVVEGVPEKAIEEEYRAQGGVKAAVYWEYIKAGKLRWWAVLIIVLALYRLVDVGETWFLKSWGEAYSKQSRHARHFMLSSSTLSSFAAQGLTDQAIPDPFASLPSPETNIRPWLVGFFVLALAQSLAYLIAQIVMMVIIYTAGRRMFADVMKRVSHATFRFYDVTPVGRLMNRLTGDCSTIDGNISNLFQNVARLSITWISAIIVIMSVTPIFLVFALALTTCFVLIFMRFLPTSQSLRRLEMVSLSPLMSNFGAVLSGLTTIRAFCAEEHFQARVIAVTDTFQKHDHFYWSLQAWLSYRFDALSACSTLVLTLLALYTGISPGLTAFVLIAAAKFVNSTHALCRQYGQLQMDFVSVERVVEMLHLEQEPPGDVSPPAWWPTLTGDIVFEDVTLRYAPHLEPSLSEISVRIKAGSNTALLGRTGSGKSTLALALLATVQPESGRILIDHVDVAKVDTQALRRRITFLAQEPVLFPGSMRENLDPLEEYSNEACEDVLLKICGRHNWTLETHIETGGRNLSQGQRQLVGLARALLRRSPIVIFDEATASIDSKTAVQIQQILRDEMKESTVITIAHRLEAVKHADYCIILGKGRVLKQGKAADMI